MPFGPFSETLNVFIFFFNDFHQFTGHMSTDLLMLSLKKWNSKVHNLSTNIKVLKIRPVVTGQASGKKNSEERG